MSFKNLIKVFSIIDFICNPVCFMHLICISEKESVHFVKQLVVVVFFPFGMKLKLLLWVLIAFSELLSNAF